ncbi:hypothetical protein GTQ43_16860 [Nostoc sp. KVJ3]|uniref:hypothetical protein n=1 Tax=Nostoc sp. KVJ3 TaxID=457945 RepID=UPI0022371C2D|nr:hypothetical protein [Nostoc sp. KVJ3]MCW5315416.1 hypothetical protein [Nostoc sp. KVJ3]
MQIPDLSYLHSVSEDELILGSAGVSVTSKALSLGSTIYNSVSSTSSSKTLLNGASIVTGTGLAKAVGTHTTAKVTVALNGSLTIGKAPSNSSNNGIITSGFLIKISLI